MKAWPDAVRIDDARAARLLFNPRTGPLLAPFMQGETSVSAAAKAAGLPPSTVLKAVRRFERLGLVEQVGLSSVVKGRKVALFRSIARRFVVNIELVDDVLLGPEKFWRTIYDRSLVDEARRYSLTQAPISFRASIESGEYRIDAMVGSEPFSPGLNGPVVFFDWSSVTLTPDQAKELQRDLDQLCKKYSQHRGQTEGLPFVVGLHLTPRVDFDIV